MRRNTLKTLLVGALLLASPALAATPDGLLTAKTKLSLWTTAGVKSSAVHVDTNGGTVTLYGKVPTQEQRSLAEKLARSVTDVKAVKNLLQVVPEAQARAVARSDKDLLDEARKALKKDALLERSEITLRSVDAGVVLLSGKAKTLSEHLRAVQLVDRVPGVRWVASEVEGPDTFGPDERLSLRREERARKAGTGAADDVRIAAVTKLRLWTSSDVPSAEINVDASDGTVTLFGMVPTDEARAAAGAQAERVAGVKRVENLLEVVPAEKQKRVEARDDEISKGLKEAFKAKPELEKVKHAVRNGVVRLTGTVASSWDELDAVRTARQVPGVRNVEDHLEVEEKAGTSVTGQN